VALPAFLLSVGAGGRSCSEPHQAAVDADTRIASRHMRSRHPAFNARHAAVRRIGITRERAASALDTRAPYIVGDLLVPHAHQSVSQIVHDERRARVPSNAGLMIDSRRPSAGPARDRERDRLPNRARPAWPTASTERPGARSADLARPASCPTSGCSPSRPPRPAHRGQSPRSLYATGRGTGSGHRRVASWRRSWARPGRPIASYASASYVSESTGTSTDPEDA
jgi:hypothetical protein